MVAVSCAVSKDSSSHIATALFSALSSVKWPIWGNANTWTNRYSKNIKSKHTLRVMLARSRRYRMVFAILVPVCLVLMRWKPMSALLSVRRPVALSREIQCEVNAKKDAIFAFDQMSAVKLIRPQESFWLELANWRGEPMRSNVRKAPASSFRTMFASGWWWLLASYHDEGCLRQRESRGGSYITVGTPDIQQHGLTNVGQ